MLLAEQPSRVPPRTHTPALLKVLRRIHRQPPKEKKQKGLPPQPSNCQRCGYNYPTCNQGNLHPARPRVAHAQPNFPARCNPAEQGEIFIGKILPRHCIARGLAQAPSAGDGSGCDLCLVEAKFCNLLQRAMISSREYKPEDFTGWLFSLSLQSAVGAGKVF